MEMNRRDFLKGLFAAAGVASFGGWRVFAVLPGWKPKKEPNLVFGVISDTHLRTMHGPTGRPGKNWPHTYLLAALEHFKKERVDAVVHLGDMAHRGQVEEMQFHADAWRKVFGKSRNAGPAKLFVTGNHDVHGGEYGDFVRSNYPDPAERARHVLATDLAANWERIWGEPYESLWHRELKGYHFFGRGYEVPELETADLLARHRDACSLADGSRPFFLLSHKRAYRPLANALKPYRDNAIGFFGHCHFSAANWNCIYNLYGIHKCFQCPSCEPRGTMRLVNDAYVAKAPLECRDETGKGRQGFIVRVYDDMLAVERREFGEGGSLGADWVVPLKAGAEEANPFTKAELRKQIGEPQFGAKTQLKLEKCMAVVPPLPKKPVAQVSLDEGDNTHPNDDNDETEEVVAKVERKREAVRLSIPLADGNPDCRVYAYDVAVAGEDPKDRLMRSVYAAGTNMGLGHEPNKGVTTLLYANEDLPRGDKLVFAVRPISSLGTFGKAIGATFTRRKGVWA